jgi:hypothetical protein
MKKLLLSKAVFVLIVVVPAIHAQTKFPLNEAAVEACMARHFKTTYDFGRTSPSGEPGLVRCNEPSERVCDISAGIRTKNYDGIKCLAEAGFDFGMDSSDLLFEAAYWDHKMLKLLMESGNLIDLEEKNEKGKTLLVKLSNSFTSGLLNRGRNFSWESFSKSVEYVLQRGADPNAASSDGETPLISQASYGRLDFMRLLLKYGADPNQQTISGETALMKSTDEIPRIRLLLESGANIYLKDKSGKTAIFYSIEECQIEKAKMLIAKDPSVLDALDNDGKSVRTYVQSKDVLSACPQIKSVL